MEVLKIELENQQNFAHYLLGTLQEMRLKYNETAKNGECFTKLEA